MSAPSSSSPSSSGQPIPLLLRVWNFGCFVIRFIRELVLANFAVAKSVLFQRRADLAPGFLDYDLRGLSSFEIVVLTHCITLTPGTASVEVSDDQKSLVVHALDARDPAAVLLSIKEGLEVPLLAWTRSRRP
jgi:multisubunit Na+/H+ antiporter MnhE subunit